MWEPALWDTLKTCKLKYKWLGVDRRKKVNSLEIYLWNSDDDDGEERVVKLFLISHDFFLQGKYTYFIGF